MSAEVSEVALVAGDGWPLGAALHLPSDGAAPGAGVVTVPGSLHERDAWTTTAAALVERGLACLLLDVRGRGSSHGAEPYAAMGPGLRRRVRLDVAAAVDHLAGEFEASSQPRIGVIAEQDTAAAATEALDGDDRIKALCLVSPRSPKRLRRALERMSVPVFGIVSSEDRPGVRATVDVYLAATPVGSRLAVHRGLGIGITMAAVRQFERPDEPLLEDEIAGWMADTLRADR